MGKILIIDDDSGLRNYAVIVVKKLGFEPIEAGSGEEGIRLYKENMPDYTLLDGTLLDMGGEEVLKSIKTINASAKVIMMTGSFSIQQRVNSLDVIGLISKPFGYNALISKLKDIIDKSK